MTIQVQPTYPSLFVAKIVIVWYVSPTRKPKNLPFIPSTKKKSTFQLEKRA